MFRLLRRFGIWLSSTFTNQLGYQIVFWPPFTIEPVYDETWSDPVPWARSIYWQWFLGLKRFHQEQTSLADIYIWSFAIGPLEVRKWHERSLSRFKNRTM